MRVFVPVEDSSFDARAGVLVPYRCGIACEHGLRDERTMGASSTSARWREPQPAPVTAHDSVVARRPDRPSG